MAASANIAIAERGQRLLAQPGLRRPLGAGHLGTVVRHNIRFPVVFSLFRYPLQASHLQ